MPVDPRQTYGRDTKAADLEFSASERSEKLQPLLFVMRTANGRALLASGLASFPTQTLPGAVAAVNILSHDQVGPSCGRELLRKDRAITTALVDAVMRAPLDDVSFWAAQDSEAHMDRTSAVYSMLSTLGFMLSGEPRCVANEVTFGRFEALCTFLFSARKLWGRSSAGAGYVTRFTERLAGYSRVVHKVTPALTLASSIDLALAIFACGPLQLADPHTLGRAMSAVGTLRPDFDVVGGRVQALGLARSIGDALVIVLNYDAERLASNQATQYAMHLITWFIGDGPGSESVRSAFVTAGVPAAIAPLINQAPPDDCSFATTTFWMMISAMGWWTLGRSDVEALVGHGYIELMAKATTFRITRDLNQATPPNDARPS